MQVVDRKIVSLFFFFFSNIFKETSPTAGNDVVDSTLDSPTTSRGIDMMDLDPNMMDEPYDSGFLQSSAPIPIRHVMRIIKLVLFFSFLFLFL